MNKVKFLKRLRVVFDEWMNRGPVITSKDLKHWINKADGIDSKQRGKSDYDSVTSGLRELYAKGDESFITVNNLCKPKQYAMHRAKLHQVTHEPQQLDRISLLKLRAIADHDTDKDLKTHLMSVIESDQNAMDIPDVYEWVSGSDSSHSYNEGITNERFRYILKSIEVNELLNLRYKSTSNHSQPQRLCFAIKLVYDQGHWNLYAIDVESEAPKNFRLDRVESLKASGQLASMELREKRKDYLNTPWGAFANKKQDVEYILEFKEGYEHVAEELHFANIKVLDKSEKKRDTYQISSK